MQYKHEKKTLLSDGSLSLVGSGIKFYAHLTQEAKAHIEQADKVLYLVNEPLMQQWIEKNARNAKSLDDIYHASEKRIEAYNAITKAILDELKPKIHVCVVIYGHPCIFSKPGLEAARLAKKEGYRIHVLPGISSADCLFADLLIDPGNAGCQLFEASDFFFNKKQLDPQTHLLLWQIDAIGCADQSSQPMYSAILNDFTVQLLNYYPHNHPAILYTASQYPHFEPIIKQFELQLLPKQILTRITTLYVPPLQSYAD